MTQGNKLRKGKTWWEKLNRMTPSDSFVHKFTLGVHYTLLPDSKFLTTKLRNA